MRYPWAVHTLQLGAHWEVARMLAASAEAHRLVVVEMMEARRRAAKDLLTKAAREWTEASCSFRWMIELAPVGVPAPRLCLCYRNTW